METNNRWAVISEHTAQRAAESQQRAREEARQRLQAATWEATWERVIERGDAADYLELAEFLREGKYPFWIDCWEMMLLRTYSVRQFFLRNQSDEDADRLQVRMGALRLIKMAVQNDQGALNRELQETRDYGLHGWLGEVMLEWPYFLEAWNQWGPPATPLLKRSEISIALANKLHGFTKTGLSRKIQAGEMQEKGTERSAANRNAIYSRFLHRQQDVQWNILCYVLDWLQTAKNSRSFSTSIWLTQPLQLLVE